MGCSESKQEQPGIINNTVLPDVGSAVGANPNAIAIEEAIAPNETTQNPNSSLSMEHTYQMDGTGFLFRDQVDKKLSSSLITVIKKGDLDKVKDIIEKNEDSYDSLGMWSSTPLLVACQYNQKDISLYLLEHPKCNSSYVNHVNEKQATALLFCCLETGMVQVIEKMIEIGAVSKINKASSVYCSMYDKNISLCCLSASIVTGNLEATKLLLENPNSIVRKVNELKFDMNFGKGLLIVPGILNKDANDMKTSRGVNSGGFDLNPLMLACVYGQLDTIEYLLNLIKGDENVSIFKYVDSNKCTVMHHICKSMCGNEDIIKSMLLLIIDAVAPDELKKLMQMVDCEGNSALHYGCDNKLSTILPLLIKYGSTVDCQNTHGVTPLYVATKKRNEECISMLLDCNANPLLGDNSTPSMTPMALGKKLRVDSKIHRMFDAASVKWNPAKSPDENVAGIVNVAELNRRENENISEIIMKPIIEATAPGSPPRSSPMRSRGSSKQVMEKAAMEASAAVVSTLVPAPPVSKPNSNQAHNPRLEVSNPHPLTTDGGFKKGVQASTARKLVLPPLATPTSDKKNVKLTELVSPPNTTREIIMDFSPVPATNESDVTKSPTKSMHDTTRTDSNASCNSQSPPLEAVSKKLNYMRGASDLVLQDL